MSTLIEIAEALAAALQPLRDEIEDLQIYPYFLLNPTPPAIDIYPGDPFQTGSGFDPAEKNLYWTIRARWTTADPDASQQGLLSLLDPTGLEAALYADDTLGGVVGDVAVVDDTPTGYREYIADTASNGRLLGAEWRVHVIMSANGAAPPVITAPAAPTLSSATPDDAAVTLAWTPHATGGSVITGYKIYRGTVSGAETLLTTVGTVTVFLDDTVTNGTEYFYKVSAVNTVGESSLSNELAATPDEAPPAGLPLLDDFNRANGPLGANWAQQALGGDMPVILTNQAGDITGGASEVTAVWTADVFPPDQQLELTVTPDTVGNIYLLLDVAAAAPFTGYLFDWATSGGNKVLTVYRANSGSYTNLGSSAAMTWAAGDTVGAHKTGDQITFTQNGVVKHTITDPSPLTSNGYAGFGIRDSTSIRVDDFKAGPPL